MRATGVLALSSIVTSLGNVAFFVLLARLGGARQYGAGGSLLSFGTLAGFLATGVQYAVARTAIVSEGTGGVVLRRVWRGLLPGIVAGGTLLLVSPLVAAYLHLASIGSAELAALLFGVTAMLAVPMGILQGMYRFGTIAALLITGTAFRLLVSYPLLTLADATWGSVLASLLSVCVVMALAWRSALDSTTADTVLQGDTNRSNRGGLVRDSVSGTVLVAGLWLVWTCPILFAKHYLPANAAASFIASQSFATFGIYLAASCIAAFYPLVAVRWNSQLALRGLGVTIALSMTSTLVLVAIGPTMIRVLYGASFSASPIMFATLGGSSICVAVSSYLLWIARTSTLGRANVWASLAVVVGCELSLASELHSGAMQLAMEPGIATLLGLCAVGIGMQRATRRSVSTVAVASTAYLG